MWRMPRSTAQTVRCSSEVPAAGSQLAIAAQLTVLPADGHGADIGAHSRVGPGLVPQRRLAGRGSRGGRWGRRRPGRRAAARPSTGRRWPRATAARGGPTSGPVAVPVAMRCTSSLSSPAAAGADRVAACSAARSSRTRSCRAVARSPRAVARAATSASPTRRSSTLVARLSETAPTRAATSMRGSVSIESVCHRPESPTHSSSERVSGSSGESSPGGDGPRGLDEEEHLADGRRAERHVGVDRGQRHTDAVADAQRPRDATGVGELDVHVRQGNPAT